MSDNQQEIPQSWTWRLRDEYNELRRKIPQFSQLSRPTFCIDVNRNSALGQWNNASKMISISARLLREASYADILFVLKHEMAHQLADEFFTSQGETAHGPSFHRACALMGISPEASFALEKDAKKEKILRRIDKLLALGQSPNHNEAESALAKAQEVALRYNIEREPSAATENYSLRLVGPVGKRLASHLGIIANICTEFYFVEAVLKASVVEDQTSGREEYWRQWELCGSLENLELADYIFHFLLNQGEREWQLYRQKEGKGVGRFRNTFLFGLYDAFREKLRDERRTLESRYALIYKGDAGLDDFFKERYPTARTRTRRVSQHANISAAGAKAGAQLRIKPGIKKGSKVRNNGRLLNG